MRPRIVPLPIDDARVASIGEDINDLNRSERHKVHQHILVVSRDAHDKWVTNNATLVATRLDQWSYDCLLNICEDQNIRISDFTRRVLIRAIRQEIKNAERRYA